MPVQGRWADRYPQRPKQPLLTVSESLNDAYQPTVLADNLPTNSVRLTIHSSPYVDLYGSPHKAEHGPPLLPANVSHPQNAGGDPLMVYFGSGGAFALGPKPGNISGAMGSSTSTDFSNN